MNTTPDFKATVQGAIRDAGYVCDFLSNSQWDYEIADAEGRLCAIIRFRAKGRGYSYSQWDYRSNMAAQLRLPRFINNGAGRWASTPDPASPRTWHRTGLLTKPESIVAKIEEYGKPADDLDQRKSEAEEVRQKLQRQVRELDGQIDDWTRDKEFAKAVIEAEDNDKLMEIILDRRAMLQDVTGKLNIARSKLAIHNETVLKPINEEIAKRDGEQS